MTYNLRPSDASPESLQNGATISTPSGRDVSSEAETPPFAGQVNGAMSEKGNSDTVDRSRSSSPVESPILIEAAEPEDIISCSSSDIVRPEPADGGLAGAFQLSSSKEGIEADVDAACAIRMEIEQGWKFDESPWPAASQVRPSNRTTIDPRSATDILPELNGWLRRQARGFRTVPDRHFDHKHLLELWQTIAGVVQSFWLRKYSSSELRRIGLAEADLVRDHFISFAHVCCRLVQRDITTLQGIDAQADHLVGNESITLLSTQPLCALQQLLNPGNSSIDSILRPAGVDAPEATRLNISDTLSRHLDDLCELSVLYRLVVKHFLKVSDAFSLIGNLIVVTDLARLHLTQEMVGLFEHLSQKVQQRLTLPAQYRHHYLSRLSQ